MNNVSRIQGGYRGSVGSQLGLRERLVYKEIVGNNGDIYTNATGNWALKKVPTNPLIESVQESETVKPIMRKIGKTYTIMPDGKEVLVDKTTIVSNQENSVDCLIKNSTGGCLIKKDIKTAIITVLGVVVVVGLYFKFK